MIDLVTPKEKALGGQMKRLMEGWLLITILFFTVAVSAGKRPCVNYRYGEHLTARFDPRKCWDTTASKWRCNDVEFDPQELHVK